MRSGPQREHGKWPQIAPRMRERRSFRIAPKPTAMPKALEREFKKNAAAWRNFQAFPPGDRRMTIGWVASAKKEETQRSRLEKSIAFSAKDKGIELIGNRRKVPVPPWQGR
jgi:hypothetical protein